MTSVSSSVNSSTPNSGNSAASASSQGSQTTVNIKKSVYAATLKLPVKNIPKSIRELYGHKNSMSRPKDININTINTFYEQLCNNLASKLDPAVSAQALETATNDYDLAKQDFSNTKTTLDNAKNHLDDLKANKKPNKQGLADAKRRHNEAKKHHNKAIANVQGAYEALKMMRPRTHKIVKFYCGRPSIRDELNEDSINSNLLQDDEKDILHNQDNLMRSSSQQKGPLRTLSKALVGTGTLVAAAAAASVGYAGDIVVNNMGKIQNRRDQKDLNRSSNNNEPYDLKQTSGYTRDTARTFGEAVISGGTKVNDIIGGFGTFMKQSGHLTAKLI